MYHNNNNIIIQCNNNLYLYMVKFKATSLWGCVQLKIKKTNNIIMCLKIKIQIVKILLVILAYEVKLQIFSSTCGDRAFQTIEPL